MPLPTPLADDTDVRAILEEDHVPDGLDLEPFRLAAVVAMNARGFYTKYVGRNDELKVIETWLAAHFTCIAYPLLSQEEIGKSEERVERKIDMGLDQTPYGQMVKVLDGEFLLFARKRLIITWLGTVPAGVGSVP